MGEFRDKVVMVTGASGNMGRAIVGQFWAAGARLALVDRRMEPLRGAFPDIVDNAERVSTQLADLTDPQAVAVVVRAIVAQFGRLDVLVHTVGGYRAGTPLHETPLDTLDFMLKLNTTTVFITNQAVIPQMLAQGGGKIVNIAARTGLQGQANAAAYSAAKAGVLRLTESMAAELRESGINVNCIIPGTLDTPQNRQSMPDADHRRWVSLESIADVVMFLTSAAARDVHGVALPVLGLT